ncbi:cation:proton antiporter regulatory subunit [Nocardia thailandica]|uniref:Cation:proton antiporter regulatory subunit n=1 Tax=Nocardia thailandica TaxID=257275 RepID=A0ABW6PQ79_9NOCA|nr:cation:proton antiporter regulatory subunit [Nocardia thailandica]
MNVDVTALPGIGVRKDFEVRSGRRIGVVAHRDGDIDLIVSKPEDPDACAAQVPLSIDEAAVLANLLGAPQLVAKLNDDHRDLPGITTRQLGLAEDSPYAGRTLGETAMRTRTKTSIVAVMRAGQLHPSPGPDFTFTSGDLLVVVGTPEGLDAAAKILTHG